VLDHHVQYFHVRATSSRLFPMRPMFAMGPPRPPCQPLPGPNTLPAKAMSWPCGGVHGGGDLGGAGGLGPSQTIPPTLARFW
jgi:hypothetical protein